MVEDTSVGGWTLLSAGGNGVCRTPGRGAGGRPARRAASLYNLPLQGEAFGPGAEVARARIDGMLAVVRGWRELFTEHDVDAKSMEMLELATPPECSFRQEPQAPQVKPERAGRPVALLNCGLLFGKFLCQPLGERSPRGVAHLYR